MAQEPDAPTTPHHSGTPPRHAGLDPASSDDTCKKTLLANSLRCDWMPIKFGMMAFTALSKAAMVTWQTPAKTSRTAVGLRRNDVVGRDALHENSCRFRSKYRKTRPCLAP
jgi:hypothetical protein